jgi:hypothetical protein
VHFQFNFLCRPQWTLMNFIFESQRRRPTSDIRQKLEYLVDYAYYAEIIKRYIDDRGLAELTYEEFGELLGKLDQEIVARHSSVELALMTRPILRFIESAMEPQKKPIADSTIPLNAAIVFFEDKKLDNIKERLESERDRNAMTEISLQQLANIIEKVRTGDEAAEARFPDEHPDVQPVVAPQEEVEPPVREQPDKPNRPVKVFSDFEEDLPPVPPEVVRIQQTVGEPIAIDSLGGGLVNLQSLFSPSEEKTFIKRLFNKDEFLFRDGLDRMNDMTEWHEASKYLQEMFITNDVDPFSEEAILFTDKIQRRFSPTIEGSNESA